MKRRLVILLKKNCFLIPLVTLLIGCQAYKPIYNNIKLDNYVATFSIAANQKPTSKHYHIHVKVDGADFRYYYLFYSDKVIKQDFRQKGSIRYVLTSDKEFSTGISPIDKAIFERVGNIADSLQINYLFDFKSAAGFNITRN